jgi:solute carrier family 13 (sodium-dependent dicarboxylate transporter), member 2/3/5
MRIIFCMENLPSSYDQGKKILIYVFAIIIFFIGFNLAPSSMEDGQYVGTFVYDDNIVNIQVQFNFEISSLIPESLHWRNETAYQGDWKLEVFYFFLVSGKVNTQFKVLINLYYFDELQKDVDIQNYSGIIISDQMRYEIKPISKNDGQILFQFRVLKFAGVMLGLLLMISFLWLTEPIPLGAVALIVPILIIISGLDEPNGAFSQFFNPIIVLLLCSFLMAEALRKVHLDKKLAIFLLSKVPANAPSIIISLMVLSAFFSMFISNTAAAAIFIPLGITILSFLEEDYPKYRKSVVLGIGFSASLGGVGSLIGTPANLIAVQFLYNYDGTIITFVDWFFIGIPILIFMLPIIYLGLWLKFRPNVPRESLEIAKKRGIKSLLEDQKRYGWVKGEPTKKDQSIISIIFIGVFILWLTSEFHGLHVGVSAAIGVSLMFLLGYLEKEDFNKISLNTILGFGGGITLGTALLRTGLAEYMAMNFAKFATFPTFIILLLISLLTIIITSIASNTATASILIPIFMPLGIILGVSPVLIAVLIAIICSIPFATVIGTPPTMIAYSTGYVNSKEIFQVGSVIDIIGVIGITLITFLFYQNILGFLLK